MRRRVHPAASGDVMPPELTIYSGNTAADYSAHLAARREWLLGHGINPGDFTRVRQVQAASEFAHGLPDSSALARARSARSTT